MNIESSKSGHTISNIQFSFVTIKYRLKHSKIFSWIYSGCWFCILLINFTSVFNKIIQLSQLLTVSRSILWRKNTIPKLNKTYIHQRRLRGINLFWDYLELLWDCLGFFHGIIFCCYGIISKVSSEAIDWLWRSESVMMVNSIELDCEL